jgi:hypothetical protein
MWSRRLPAATLGFDGGKNNYKSRFLKGNFERLSIFSNGLSLQHFSGPSFPLSLAYLYLLTLQTAQSRIELPPV